MLVTLLVHEYDIMNMYDLLLKLAQISIVIATLSAIVAATGCRNDHRAVYLRVKTLFEL